MRTWRVQEVNVNYNEEVWDLNELKDAVEGVICNFISDTDGYKCPVGTMSCEECLSTMLKTLYGDHIK